ncbi:MAG: hypothetical protein MI748_00290, partial [Opitutales bacterium]|nr:hypothetical protein [Opitutales bacterium]
MNTLLSRGIEKERVVFFSQLKNQIEIAHREGDVLLCGLSPLHTDEQEALWESESDLRCVKWMTGCIEQIEHLALSEPKPSCTQVKSIEILSSSYLEFRKHWAGIHPQVYKRFLFPSPGRCGGYSITRALRFHPSLNLRVDHEGNATLIYRLLLLHNRGWISETPLVAILSSMLDEQDCLGGNPICFLMPLLERIPWFKYYLLKVKRPVEQHL